MKETQATVATDPEKVAKVPKTELSVTLGRASRKIWTKVARVRGSGIFRSQASRS